MCIINIQYLFTNSVTIHLAAKLMCHKHDVFKVFSVSKMGTYIDLF